jgi:tetratricopeptide (TPR) repeat protein
MKSFRKRAVAAMILISATVMLSSCSRNPQRAKVKYLAAGQNFMTKGQYGDAAIEFRNALRLDPRFVDAYYELAQATLAQHDWRTAYASLQKAIELDPTRLDARLDRGRLYLAARQFSKSEDEANFILKQDPKEVAAYQLLGASLIGERKPDQALTALRKVTELLPNNSSAYVTMALVEISLNRSAEAEEHLKKAVAVDPKSTQAYTDLADFYRLEHQDSQAQQVLQDGIAKNADGTVLYVQWASMLASQGQKDQADAILDKLRAQLPNSPAAAMAIGDFYLQSKQVDRGMAEYRRGLTVAPTNLDIKKRMLDLYLQTNQLQPATDLDQDLMKDAPKDVFVRVDHGRLLLAQGKTTDSINYLQKIVADAADSPQAHYFLGMAYSQNGETGRAVAALQDALRILPGLPVALQELVRLSLSQGDVLNAQSYAQELVQRHPADPTNRALLAETLARKGLLGQAEEQGIVARQLAPNDPVGHLNLGHIYEAERKWPEAQKEFESAAELDTRNTAALGQLADFLASRNQMPQALSRIQQFVDANPNDPNAHIILGFLDFESKKYDLAQAEFSRAIELDPKNEQAYLRLGKVYEEEGRKDLAIAPYQKALDLQPRLAPLATMIGNRYLEKGDLQTAQKYYGQALEADPNFAVANANMAWVDAQQSRNLDVALGMAQKAKSLMPDIPSITDTLGWVLYKKGNYTGAIPLLQECVSKSPDSAEFHYHLGMTLLATGERAKGKDQIETAMRMKLGNDDARQAQQALAQLN